MYLEVEQKRLLVDGLVDGLFFEGSNTLRSEACLERVYLVVQVGLCNECVKTSAKRIEWVGFGCYELWLRYFLACKVKIYICKIKKSNCRGVALGVLINRSRGRGSLWDDLYMCMWCSCGVIRRVVRGVGMHTCFLLSAKHEGDKHSCIQSWDSTLPHCCWQAISVWRWIMF